MEDNASYVLFVETWSLVMVYGSMFLVFAAFATVIVHKIRVGAISDYKEKYEYINKNEIKWYKFSYILIGVAVAFICNNYFLSIT